jgi:hypothetical protein
LRQKVMCWWPRFYSNFSLSFCVEVERNWNGQHRRWRSDRPITRSCNGSAWKIPLTIQRSLTPYLRKTIPRNYSLYLKINTILKLNTQTNIKCKMIILPLSFMRKI